MSELSFKIEQNPAANLARITEALLESLSADREPKASAVGLIKETDRGELVVNQQKWKHLKDQSLFNNAVNRIAQQIVKRAYDDGNTFTTPQRYIVITWAGQAQEDVIDRQTLMVIPGQHSVTDLATMGPAGLAAPSFEQQLAVESMRLMVQESSEANRAMMAMYRNEIENLRTTIAKRDETIERLYITLAGLQEKAGLTQERLSSTIVNTQEKTVGVIDRHIQAIEQHRDGSIERELRLKREAEKGGYESKAWELLMGYLPKMAQHVLSGGQTMPTMNTPSAVIGWLQSLPKDKLDGIEAMVDTLPEETKAAYYAAVQADVNKINGVSH